MLLAVEQTVGHLIVALTDEAEVVMEGLVARRSLVGGSDEAVSDAAEGTHHDNHGILTAFYDLLYVRYACNGTHAGSTEFQYVHCI